MDGLTILVGILGLILGGLTVFLLERSKRSVLNHSLQTRGEELTTLRDAKSALEQKVEQYVRDLTEAQTLLRAEEERLAALLEMEDRFKETFGGVAADALQKNNRVFLDLAQQNFEKLQEGARGELEKRKQAVEAMVKPVSDTLSRVGQKIEEVERVRREAHGGLMNELVGLKEAQNQLQSETASLVNALRAPTVRGQWGEMQLRRVVEMAGMEEHCDFDVQVTMTGTEGRLRPDLVVKLPAGRSIAVDAKVPLEHFLKALDAESETDQKVHFGEHLRLVRGHVTSLSSRDYWDALAESPDFVVMFMSDAVYSAAVRQDAALFEFAYEKRVLLATPMLLIGLLKTVAYSWRQEQLAESAREISALGKDLHDRLAKMAEHFAKVGKGLSNAVSGYNNAMGSLESRVLVTARKFQELGVRPAADMPQVGRVDVHTRELSARELVGVGSGQELADYTG